MVRRSAGALAPALVAFAVFGYLAVAPEYYHLRWLRGAAGDATFLRKAYSLAAFTVTGFFLAMAQRKAPGDPSVLRVATLVALFSAAIEIAQRFAGSHESLTSNAVDVGFGAAGGALGAAAERALATYCKRCIR